MSACTNTHADMHMCIYTHAHCDPFMCIHNLMLTNTYQSTPSTTLPRRSHEQISFPKHTPAYKPQEPCPSYLQRITC